MTELTTERPVWDMPEVTTDPKGISRITFRDCIVDIAEGMVTAYFDKVRSVYLRPSGLTDTWEVFTQTGESSGQHWRGIIAYDGSQLLIQQARNSLFRLYRTDGEIETQLRMSRIVERPDRRAIVFQHGQAIEEDFEACTITTYWGDRSVIRCSDGDLLMYDAQGREVEVPPLGESGSVENPVITVFERMLQPWQRFAPANGSTEFVYGGPPGLAEAAPGEPFQIAVVGKPNDFREVMSHDFEDGTILHEYLGRLGGPFMAHEVVTYEGQILARCVEYDQPKSIAFCDPRGIIRQHDDVLKAETQFDPATAEYVTCITDAKRKEYIHPKGAKFERFSGPT